MILDIQLPSKFGSEVLPDGGVEFLKELKRSPDLSKPYHVIGITSHQESIKQFTVDFENEIWTLIKYEEQYNSWRTMLKNKIAYLIQSKKELLNQVNTDYQYDIAIVTALKSELEAVLELSGDWEEEQYDNDKSSVFHIGVFKSEKKTLSIVAAYCPQMGMTAASVTSFKLINRYRPKYIVMLGIAAGIRSKANIGDILIAEHS